MVILLFPIAILVGAGLAMFSASLQVVWVTAKFSIERPSSLTDWLARMLTMMVMVFLASLIAMVGVIALWLAWQLVELWL
jgi:hypothetical protein